MTKKSILAPMPGATADLRKHLEARLRVLQQEFVQYLRDYEKFLSKHSHPSRHNKPVNLLQKAGKTATKIEQLKLVLAGLPTPLQIEATNGATEKEKVKA